MSVRAIFGGALLLLFGVIIYTRMSASESFLIHQTPVGSRSTILGIYYFTGMAGGTLLTVSLICSFWLREKRK